jgi:hypothetical protein
MHKGISGPAFVLTAYPWILRVTGMRLPGEGR